METGKINLGSVLKVIKLLISKNCIGVYFIWFITTPLVVSEKTNKLL